MRHMLCSIDFFKEKTVDAGLERFLRAFICNEIGPGGMSRNVYPYDRHLCAIARRLPAV